MSTTYEIKVLGELWMGGAAASSTTVREPMEYARCDDETDVEYETRMVECAAETGDFATVTALEITRVDITADDSLIFPVTRTVETRTTLRAFSDDDAMTWDDIMFPMEWEDA